MELIPKLLPATCYGATYRLTPAGVVVHYVSARDAWKVLPGLKKGTYDIFDVELVRRVLQHFGFSYHDYIDRDGTEYQLAPFDRPAWHAGASILNGRDGCNFWTYGLAFASTGEPVNGEPAYTDKQLVVGQRRVAQWMSRDGFDVDAVAGHQDVRAAAIAAGLSKTPKPDPGPLFPWDWFLGPLRNVIPHPAQEIQA